MSYEVRFVPEVEQWLSEIRLRDRTAADRIDAALAVLRADGESVGPPLVMPFGNSAGQDEPALIQGDRGSSSSAGLHVRVHMPSRGKSLPGTVRRLLVRNGSKNLLAGLDAAYQQQLAELARLRRAVGATATSRKQLDMKVEQVEQQIVRLGAAGPTEAESGLSDMGEGQVSGATLERELADFRSQYELMQEKEQRLSAASLRLQARLGDYAAGKEALETAYVALREASDAAWAEVAGDVDNSATLGDARAERPHEDRPAQLAPRLSELRPGAPESTGIRILFAVEPTATAVLLAAGMQDDWLQAWYDEARTLCHLRYERYREA